VILEPSKEGAETGPKAIRMMMQKKERELKSSFSVKG